MAVGIQTAVEFDRETVYVNGNEDEKNMAGARHSGVGTRLLRKVGNFVEEHRLGEVYGADATFLIGQRDRLPDFSFVSFDRLPAAGEPSSKWLMAPDLAVEVTSPNDLFEEVQNKLWDYFAAGVRQVWLVDPEHQSLAVYRSPFDVTMFGADNELVSEDLLPGFRCRLSTIFNRPQRSAA